SQYRDIEKAAEAGVDCLAVGQLVQYGAREGILFVNPGTHFGCGGVFQPAVGVRNSLSVQGFRDIIRARGRIGVSHFQVSAVREETGRSDRYRQEAAKHDWPRENETAPVDAGAFDVDDYGT